MNVFAEKKKKRLRTMLRLDFEGIKLLGRSIKLNSRVRQKGNFSSHTQTIYNSNCSFTFRVEWRLLGHYLNVNYSYPNYLSFEAFQSFSDFRTFSHPISMYVRVCLWEMQRWIYEGTDRRSHLSTSIFTSFGVNPMNIRLNIL